VTKICLVGSFLLILSAPALGACGGSDPAGEVEEVIEVAAASTDPADCTKLQTQGFTEQSSHETGGGAVKLCERQAREGEGVKAATVSNVKVQDSKATAKATLEGGTLDGQTVELALIKSGDQWKLDEIVEFVKFDEQKLIEGLEGEFEEKSGKVSANFAHCFIEHFNEGGKGEVEELLLTPPAEEVEGVARICA
jgi:hypothetical protein